MIILYLTDAWNGNPEVLAICTSKKKAIKLANTHSGYKLDSEDVRNLETINQTQLREAGENYQIQEVATNILL